MPTFIVSQPGIQGPAGPSYAATSSTSITVGTGSKAFTIGTGYAYSAGARARATSSGSGAFCEGVVASYTGGVLTITVDATSGSGAHTDWNVNIAGQVGAQGPQGVGYTPRGAYAGGTTYAQGDQVTYSGVLYLSLVGSNTGNQPDISPSYWMSMAGTGLADSGANGVLVRTSLGVTAPAKADDLSGPTVATSTGSANAYLVTLSPATSALVANSLYRFKSNFANTGAATVNFDSHGAKTIKKLGATTDLVANDILSGQEVVVVHDGTYMQMVSPVGNAPASAVGGTVLYTAGNATNAFIVGLGAPATDSASSTPATAAPRSGTLKNLYVNAQNSAGATLTVTVRINGTPSALTCTLSSSATGHDTTHSVSVNAGDLIDVYATTNAGGGQVLSASMEFD